MPIAHWLYPVNPASAYYLSDSRGGARKRVTAENLWGMIAAQPYEPDSWYLSTGYRSLRPDDLLWIYVAGRQEICALAHVMRIEQHRDKSWHAQVLWDGKATAALRFSPLPRSSFKQIPQSPCRANSATSRLLDTWLAKQSLQYADPAEDAAPISDEDARRRVLATIIRRRGQTQFRQGLLTSFGGRCAATGETALEVLEAAHIDPYRGAHSNVLSNGLLLRADLHSLFDLNLIGVDNHKRWVVSSRLQGTSYASLAGKPLGASRSSPPNVKRLARHLARLVP